MGGSYLLEHRKLTNSYITGENVTFSLHNHRQSLTPLDVLGPWEWLPIHNGVKCSNIEHVWHMYASECSRLQWLCLCVIYKWQYSTVLLLIVQLLVFLPLLYQCFWGLGEANQNTSIDGWVLNNHDGNVKLHDVAQHLPLIYLIVLLQYKCVELLSNIPWEATLLSRVQCFK